MKLRICVCCGEPVVEIGHAPSRNPNVCNSCASLVDGMEDTTHFALPPGKSAPELPHPEQKAVLTGPPVRSARRR